MHDKLIQSFKCSFYGNTDISRNSVFIENDMSNIKLLRDKRNVVFLIGKGGRFEIDHILFDNISSTEIVFVSPINAFKDYEDILNECLAISKEKLFLFSCGPTATVLAFDLSQMGYQALDIGHLPNCYDQYKGIIDYPESLPFNKLR